MDVLRLGCRFVLPLALLAPSAAGSSAALRSTDAATFTPAGVRACLYKARTSVGTVLVDGDPFYARNVRASVVLNFVLIRGDVGMPGVTIVFAPRRSDTARLQAAVYARVARRQGPGFARSLVFRRSANVVYYYQRATNREVVRIARGCLGGPRYGGDGGRPPPGLPGP
jgi:hypothetical protein